MLSCKEEDVSMAETAMADKVCDEFSYTWLLQQLPNIAHFEAVRTAVITALRSALQVETHPPAIAAYLRFLACHAANDPLQDLADLTLVCHFN